MLMPGGIRILLTMRTILPSVLMLVAEIAVLPIRILLLLAATATLLFLMAVMLLGRTLADTILLVIMRQARTRARILPPLGSSSVLIRFLGRVLKVVLAGVKMAQGFLVLRALVKLVLAIVVIRASKLGPVVVMLMTALVDVLLATLLVGDVGVSAVVAGSVLVAELLPSE